LAVQRIIRVTGDSQAMDRQDGTPIDAGQKSLGRVVAYARK